MESQLTILCLVLIVAQLLVEASGEENSLNLDHLLQQTIVQRLAQGKGSPVVTPSEEEANANLLNIFGFVQQVLEPWLISPFLKVKGFRFYIAPIFSCLPLNMS